MACAHPERVLGQILIGPVPASAMPLPPELADDWLRSIATREGYHRFESQFTREPLAADVLDDCFDSIHAAPEHTLRETLRMCPVPGFAEDLAGLRVPTLVIGGAHDPMMTPDFLRHEVVNKIPGARLALLDCGHNAPLEKPAETAALIEDFAASLSG